MSWISSILNRTKIESREASADNPDEGIAAESGSIIADNPIRRTEDDLLGRARAARAFAEQVLSFGMTEGVVVGVLGPWGSGKTSFINLARTHLESAGVEVLDFNPWMFSGAEQLVDSFFVEVSAQLKVRPALSNVGKSIEEYGEIFSGLGWLPVVGPWIERVRAGNKVLAKMLQRRKEGVGSRRAKVEAVLSQLKSPFAVVVDDIDRLTSSEIRDVFRLVRLTANFPNVIYILAFDRLRVETALAENGVLGRDYLEKILQVAIDIPAAPPDVLSAQALHAIAGAISPIENSGPFDSTAWPDVYAEVIRPLVRNMRDVRRYAAAIHGTVKSLDGQAALVDVLALEAVRVFLPDVFHDIHASISALTSTYDEGIDRAGTTHLKSQIEHLIEIATPYGAVIRAVIGRVFPAARRHIENNHYGGEWKRRWLKDRRLAHEEMLRLYLERVAGPGLQAFSDGERAWTRMADQVKFEEYLRSLDRARLRDVIASLETYEPDFRPEHVVPGTTVLLNLLPDLPVGQSGMFELRPEMVVGRVFYRLLRSLQNPDSVADAVRQILPQVKTLSSKLELIDTVGYRENVGQKLVSEAAADEFERNWRDELRVASTDTLATERGLLWMLRLAKKCAGPQEAPIEVRDEPEVTLAVLRSARSEVLGQSIGNRAVQRTPHLAWKELVDLYGDEDTLRTRLERLKASQPPRAGDDQLLELVDQYLSGSRPPDMFRGQ
jgi:hypothetical protein